LPRGRRHYRITLADAIAAHERALSTGGLSGLGDLNSLQSAIARPYSGYYRPIARKAAALMQSVATNHPFADGNKRTSILLVDLLLSRSSYRLEPLPGEDINRLVEDFVVDCVVPLDGRAHRRVVRAAHPTTRLILEVSGAIAAASFGGAIRRIAAKQSR
jgi:death-on-curing protein